VRRDEGLEVDRLSRWARRQDGVVMGSMEAWEVFLQEAFGSVCGEERRGRVRDKGDNGKRQAGGALLACQLRLATTSIKRGG
jgi:hypothetical protein